jgi:hypothetical protein
MKKNNRLFILLILFVPLIMAMDAWAGEKSTPSGVTAEANAKTAISTIPIGELFHHPIGIKLKSADLEHIRGKGYGYEVVTSATASPSGRIVLWDENHPSGTNTTGEMNLNWGSGGKQINRLIFRNQ